jgi:hypothetical protein
VGIDNGCRVIFFGDFSRRSSITLDVYGSSPELGSSQKRYFGLLTIALAMATLFCIPPEISDGIFYWLYQDVLFLLLQKPFSFFL